MFNKERVICNFFVNFVNSASFNQIQTREHACLLVRATMLTTRTTMMNANREVLRSLVGYDV